MADKSPIIDDDRAIKPTDGDEDEYEYIEVEERKGCSGCGWGLLGMFGCLTIPLVVAGFLVVAGINSVGGIWDSFTDIFESRPPKVEGIALVLRSVEQMGEFSNVRYNFSNIVLTGRDAPSWIPDFIVQDELTLVVVGQIEAGFDLQAALQNENFIQQEGATIIVNLPHPRLLSCFINEDQTYVAERDTGLFASQIPNLDAIARDYAIEQFRDEALENGILDEASTYAIDFFQSLISALPTEGIEQVRVNVEPADVTNSEYWASSCQ